MNTYKNRALPARMGFALRGLAHALRSERSLRLQAGAFVLVLMALIVLHARPVWWALVLLASGAVLTAELLNTAVERLADELHPQDSPGIGLVKDCAAAAVLVASLAAVAVAVAFVVQQLLVR